MWEKVSIVPNQKKTLSVNSWYPVVMTFMLVEYDQKRKCSPKLGAIQDYSQADD